MSLKLVFSALALSIGIAFAVQTSINATLARGIGSPVLATLISFGVGFAALMALSVATGQFQHVSGAGIRALPVWVWLSGGLLGASIVFGSVFLVPKIGVAALAAFVIAGQLAAAAVIDHFGLFGVPVHEIGLLRVTGLVMLFAGALLVRLT
jgi:bacterial/archaeal transporter family-2 protein